MCINRVIENVFYTEFIRFVIGFLCSSIEIQADFMYWFDQRHTKIYKKNCLPLQQKHIFLLFSLLQAHHPRAEGEQYSVFYCTPIFVQNILLILLHFLDSVIYLLFCCVVYAIRIYSNNNSLLLPISHSATPTFIFVHLCTKKYCMIWNQCRETVYGTATVRTWMK